MFYFLEWAKFLEAVRYTLKVNSLNQADFRVLRHYMYYSTWVLHPEVDNIRRAERSVRVHAS